MNLRDLVTGFQSLSAQKKIFFLVLFGSVVGGSFLFAFFASSPEYGVLYANLEEEDAGRVIAKLQEKRTPYRLTAGGRVIEVPNDQVYELRLALAGEGLANRGSTVGYEIFDKDSWNISRFVQGVNYRRALQGELARTIMSISEVERARVHLVMPERSSFVNDDGGTTKASVVLEIKGKARLQSSQVKGIVHLVSSSVDALLPEDVSVIDTAGKLLTHAKNPDEDISTASSYQMEYKRAVEDSMEQRVVRMLEKVTGKDNVIVRVAADINFQKMEKHEELFDPDSVVVRSEQKKTEKISGGSQGGGAPGLRANTPGRSPLSASSSQGRPSEKKEQILNYEINKVRKHMVELPGTINKLSVAVLLHKKEKMGEVNLDQVTSLVKGAMGFDEQRGDQVEVALLPFEVSGTENEMPLEEDSGFNLEQILPSLVKYGGLLASVLLLIFGVARPLMNNISAQGKQMADFQKQLPERLNTMDNALPGEEMGKDKLLEMVKQDPSKAAQVMRMWLRET